MKQVQRKTARSHHRNLVDINSSINRITSCLLLCGEREEEKNATLNMPYSNFEIRYSRRTTTKNFSSLHHDACHVYKNKPTTITTPANDYKDSFCKNFDTALYSTHISIVNVIIRFSIGLLLLINSFINTIYFFL